MKSMSVRTAGLANYDYAICGGDAAQKGRFSGDVMRCHNWKHFATQVDTQAAAIATRSSCELVLVRAGLNA
jgi:hypothetical protein